MEVFSRDALFRRKEHFCLADSHIHIAVRNGAYRARDDIAYAVFIFSECVGLFGIANLLHYQLARHRCCDTAEF